MADEGGPPRLLNSLPRALTDDDVLAPVIETYKLVAPLHFEDRLSGILFLGPRLSGAAYKDNDIELIEALCAVTATVLRYMGWRQWARTSGEQTVRMLTRCQEVAGGVAEHLEQMHRRITELTESDAALEDAHDWLAEVAQRTDTIRYLAHSLRLVANDPSALQHETVEKCDAAEAVQSAVMSMCPVGQSPTPMLNFRHQHDGGQPLVRFSRSTIVDAVGETLRPLLERGAARSLGVYVDRATGLPSDIGAKAGKGEPEQRLLRVRLEVCAAGADHDDERPGMKLLADNLEAFHTLRDPGPAQSEIVERGGSIVWRHERDVTVYLIYLPLLSA
jgi:hypothetical protein